MKNKITFNLFLLIVFILTSAFSEVVYAQMKSDDPSFKFGGSLRVRGENKLDYNFDDSRQGYFLSQLRINFKWKPAKWISFFVEGQDARIYGEKKNSAPKIDKDATPNIYQDEFSLHQFTATLSTKMNKTPVKLVLGRQKFNLGAQRLVASLEWVNTARVWDGARLTIGSAKKRSVDLFWSRTVPVTPDEFNDHRRTKSRYFNSQFGGAYYTDYKMLNDARFEAYWLFRKEQKIDDATHTLGARLHKHIRKFSYEIETAYQFGDFGGIDHSAFMLHLAADVKTNILNKTKFGIAYNFGSGDDDPTDNKHKTFDNLYPLNHAYYGYMDLFSLQNIHNLELTANMNVAKIFSFRLAFQSFWLHQNDTDAWYNAGLGVVRNSAVADESHIANEIDFTVKSVVKKYNLVIIVGYSHLFSGKYIEQTGNSKNPSFMFLMAKFSL